jgi:transcriptional regulator with XRE-family HTH domain
VGLFQDGREGRGDGDLVIPVLLSTHPRYWSKARDRLGYRNMTTASEYVPERRHARLTPGESLKILRELQGLSQSDLARMTRIAQSAISAFEPGTQEIGLKRAKALAIALRVRPAVIAFPDWEAEVLDLWTHRTRQATLRRPVAARKKAARVSRRTVRRRTA